MIQKTRINQILKIEDTEGQYGPQKRIMFKDDQGRSISGWVPLDRYNPQEWKEGFLLELDVAQNGKYLNFKLPTAKAKEVQVQQVEAQGQTESLRHIYKVLVEIRDSLKPQARAAKTAEPPFPEVSFDTDALDRI